MKNSIEFLLNKSDCEVSRANKHTYKAIKMNCQDLLGYNFVDCKFNVANPLSSFKLKSWFQQCMHPLA